MKHFLLLTLLGALLVVAQGCADNDDPKPEQRMRSPIDEQRGPGLPRVSGIGDGN